VVRAGHSQEIKIDVAGGLVHRQVDQHIEHLRLSLWRIDSTFVAAGFFLAMGG
jgi:hypothetical protein